ncbi:MAG: carboxymuconolactone decarboxylase family protein [Methanomicrobiales archaeon]
MSWRADPGPWTQKTAELIAVAAAAGAGAEACLKLHVKEGASRDEIYDTILIASLIGKTRVMAPALRIFADAVLPCPGE